MTTRAQQIEEAARFVLARIDSGWSHGAEKMLEADTKNYFATVGNSYPVTKAIALVTSETKRELDTQVPRVVVYARWALVIAFLLAQAVPFGLVGYAAYKDLKITT